MHGRGHTEIFPIGVDITIPPLDLIGCLVIVGTQRIKDLARSLQVGEQLAGDCRRDREHARALSTGWHAGHGAADVCDLRSEISGCLEDASATTGCPQPRSLEAPGLRACQFFSAFEWLNEHAVVTLVWAADNTLRTLHVALILIEYARHTTRGPRTHVTAVGRSARRFGADATAASLRTDVIPDCGVALVVRGNAGDPSAARIVATRHILGGLEIAVLAIEEWVENGEQSVAFRLASWRDQRAAQGDLKIAMENDSNFMAFVSNKAIANRKKFAQLLRDAVLVTDFESLRFLQSMHALVSSMNSPCLRLELLQYILNLDNRYSVAHVARSIELAATCMSISAQDQVLAIDGDVANRDK